MSAIESMFMSTIVLIVEYKVTEKGLGKIKSSQMR